LITKGQRCRRYIILALWSLVVTAWAGICAYRIGINPYQSSYQSQAFSPPAIENQINGLTYYRYDPNTSRLGFMARAGVIQTENAKLGIFKTAAARTIKVKNLQLLFCEHPGISTPSALQTLALSEATDTNQKGFQKIFTQLADARDYWNANIDLSNPCKLIINGFDCRFFDNDTPRLAVQSNLAIVDSAWPRLTLRGHVIVTGADGGILESNHVKWDIQKQTFTAEGMYVLRRGTSQIAGKNIRVDSRLNIADTKNARK
jgi:hypothetical protein